MSVWPVTSVRSNSSFRTVRTNRSAKVLALGARTGVRITRKSSVLNTSSNAPVNLRRGHESGTRRYPVGLRQIGCAPAGRPTGHPGAGLPR